ncbi:MAG: hypothetical protein M3466_20170 [Gemmatimonadota bacterium]|nr:hypothetical protein [Gemmatimonadota bacterium]
MTLLYSIVFAWLASLAVGMMTLFATENFFVHIYGNSCAYQSRRPLPRRTIVAVVLLAIACDKSGEADRGVSLDTNGRRVETPASSVASAVVTECYVDSQSVFARRPNSPAPGPAGLRGWIALEGLGFSDSGPARIADSDGTAREAGWRRGDGDTILVEAFDDFTRVEMRLLLRDSGATGSAFATSDAAFERDSDGRTQDFRRSWRVAARRTPCDSLP